MDWSKNEGGQLMSRPNMYCLPNGSTYLSILKVFHAFKFVDLFYNIHNSVDFWECHIISFEIHKQCIFMYISITYADLPSWEPYAIGIYMIWHTVLKI